MINNESEFDWHDRFTSQLKWTKQLREHIYKELNILEDSIILEAGCGTGALLLEIGNKFHPYLTGIDINSNRLNIAKNKLQEKGIRVNLHQVDILENYFPDESFDIIFTNYFFLWISDLDKCFGEMNRILKTHGKLVIFAEPDYGGLIENPNTNLKQFLISDLSTCGADPEIGRKLSRYFYSGNKNKVNRKFEIFQKYNASVPWIAGPDTNNLLKEVEFFKKIIINNPHSKIKRKSHSINNFNYEFLQESILKGNYFLYIPVFSYILEKSI